MADLIYMAKSKWAALLDSIRAKSGTSALMTADQAKAAVDAIQTGQTVFYTQNGFPYVREIVNTAVTQNTSFIDCDYLESIEAPNATSGTSVGNNYRGGYNCLALKSVKYPKCTNFGQYFIRQQGGNYNKLESVEIGSIGYPVTSLGNSIRWRYGCHAPELTVTIFVDAATIADIPAAITSYAIGDNAYAPAGSVVTVIYRNSTTGEVISA